jgi:hypothetical protein
MRTTAATQYPPHQWATWELRNRREELERIIPELAAEDTRLPRLLGELNMIIAVQEDRAGTPLCFVRDKPNGAIA